MLDNAEFAQLNPMYPAYTAWTVAFGGTLDPDGPSMLGSLVWFTLFAFVVIVVGFITFASREDEFAVRN